MKYKAVFFDFDGTLMDTSIGIVNSGYKAMQDVGVPIPENPNLRSFIGPPLMDCFKITFGVTDRATLLKLVERYRFYYREKGMFEAEFYPHIVEVLEQLKKNGYKICVASMKMDDVVKQICDVFDLTKYLDYCGGMLDDDFDTKAEIIKRGCKQLEIDPKDCVLIGDTAIDEKGAQTANVNFIKVGWGYGFVPTDEGVINDARDILNLV